MSEEVIALGVLLVVALWLAYKEVVSKKKSYSKAEWELRCDVAAMNRFIELWGWDETGYNEVVAVVGKKNGKNIYLTDGTNRRLMASTASTLTKWTLTDPDKSGRKTPVLLCPGANPPGVVRSPAQFKSIIEVGVLEKCPDLKAVVHSHHTSVVACATLRNFPPKAFGLKDQSVRHLISPKKIPMPELVSTLHEGEEIGEKYLEGGKYMICMMPGHGAMICGRTLPEAYYLSDMLHKACEEWLALLVATGGNPTEELVYYEPEETAEKIHQQIAGFMEYAAQTPLRGIGGDPWLFMRQRAPPGFDE